MGDPSHLSGTECRSSTQADRTLPIPSASLSPPLLPFYTELRGTARLKMLSANAEQKAINKHWQLISRQIPLEADDRAVELVQSGQCASICATQQGQGCTPLALLTINIITVKGIRLLGRRSHLM